MSPNQSNMITVGVRTLKNSLSYYLRHVKQGKPVTITARGKPVAILIPANERPETQAARKLGLTGIGSWKGGKPKGASRWVKVKGKPVSKIVLEERR